MHSALRHCAALLLMAPLAATAQSSALVPFDAPARGAAAWRTLHTDHFSFHYRAEFEEWTQSVASRMEAVRTAVREYVGYATEKRVTIIVDDPRNESNGNAIAWLDKPQIQLFPVPPAPRSFSPIRDWGELLAIHEFGHVAHLVRPSRGMRWYQRLAPAVGVFGPLSMRLPRWTKEGYATVIEGALTGSGRPVSAMRSAILRQFSADGLLPTYSAIDGSGGFLGGGFAYLMGSAFLEHLAFTHGDSTLPQLWRRMSAVTGRSFPAAFEQTFGVRPDDAYARYVAQLTADAVEMERALERAGRVDGTLEVKSTGGLGDPSVSPDGEKLAVALPSVGGSPARVVVWPAPPTPAAERDSVRRAAAERLLRRDPQDVPPVETPPRSKRVLASLSPVRGLPYRNPRFFADNERVLVIRSDVRSDGSVMPDLYVWNSRTGGVRRVTRGEAIREADPFPDGERAVGLRCQAGRCDVVMVSLRNGDVQELRAGTRLVQYARPRVSPDGSMIAAAQLYDGRWRPVLIDPVTGDATPVGPQDAASRYDVAWTRDGQSLVAVTDASGVPNIERIDVADGRTTPLTRVFGAALAPEPIAGDSALFFLSLTSRGYDLRRLTLVGEGASGDLTSSVPMEMVDVRRGAVATQIASTVPRYDSVATGTPSMYGLGPQRFAWLPFGGGSIGGGFGGIALFGSDPNERFSWTIQQSWRSNQPAGSGLMARGVFRIPYVEIDAEFARARVYSQRWTGGAVSLSHTRLDPLGVTGLRVGYGVHAIDDGTGADAPAAMNGRAHVWGGFQRNAAVAFGNFRLMLDVQGHVSRTAIEANEAPSVTVEHQVGSATLNAGALRFETTAGRLNDDASAAPFALGGLGVHTVNAALVPQSVAVPWLEVGALSGRTFNRHEVRLSLPGPQPFVSAVRTGADSWHRAAGAELRADMPSNGFARFPGVTAILGAAWLFDEPNADRVRAWAGVTFRP